MSRQVKITLGIWAVLFLMAIAGLLLMRAYTSRILENIYYVNVGRNSKAQVLYAEAESEARKTLQHIEQINRSSPQKVELATSYPHYKRAVSLYDQALEYDQFPEFDPSRIPAYEIYAQVLDGAGNHERQLLMNARAFRASGNAKDASDYVKQAKLAAPQSIEPYTLEAQFASADNMTTVADSILTDVASSIPLNAKAFWVRGTARVATGNITSATADLEKAVESTPKNLDYRLSLGRAYISSGQKDKAMATFSQGLNVGGFMDPVYLHVYGEYLAEMGDFNESIRMLTQADKLAPSSGDIQMSLAKAYHKAGKTRQADSALRRAIQIKPDIQKQIF